MEKVSINKIEIKIDGKIISLTLEQAKELKCILNDTFPEHVAPIVIEKHVYPWVPNYPNTPYWGIKYTGDPINMPAGTLCLSAQ